MSLWSRLFGTDPAGGPPAATVTPSRALARMVRAPGADDDEARAELLLLGPPRGPHIEFFTHRGFRVTVEDLAEVFDWARRREGGEEDLAPPEWTQPPEAFDAVVGLDVIDRVDDVAAVLALERVASVLRPGGLVFLLSDGKPAGEAAAPREIVFEGEGFRCEAGEGRPYRRRARPNRDLLKLFKGFSVQQVQLRKDGLREVLLRKPSA